jgi:hypothetical protein
MSLFLFLSANALAQSTTVSRGPLFVEVNGHLLTLRSSNMPMREVLREIGKKASFNITFHAPADELLTIEFDGIPIERGLKLITRGVNTAFVYGPQVASDQVPKIRELILYPAPGSTPKGIAPRAPAPVQPPPSPQQPAPPPPPSRPDPESIIHGLQGEDPAEKEEAISRLRELRADPRAMNRVRQSLIAEKDEERKARTIRALGDFPELTPQRSTAPSEEPGSESTVLE